MTRISSTGIKRGFTLLELMVTLFIMVLFTGVVAVSLGPALEDARLGGGTRMVLAALRSARDYAVAHQTDTAVHLGDEANGVGVYIREVDDDGVESWRPLTTPAGRTRPLPAGIEIVDITDSEAGRNTEHDPGVNFTALGRGEDVRITLRDQKQRTRTIVVDGLTGQCEVAKAATE